MVYKIGSGLLDIRTWAFVIKVPLGRWMYYIYIYIYIIFIGYHIILSECFAYNAIMNKSKQRKNKIAFASNNGMLIPNLVQYRHKSCVTKSMIKCLCSASEQVWYGKCNTHQCELNAWKSWWYVNNMFVNVHLLPYLWWEVRLISCIVVYLERPSVSRFFWDDNLLFYSALVCCPHNI